MLIKLERKMTRIIALLFSLTFIFSISCSQKEEAQDTQEKPQEQSEKLAEVYLTEYVESDNIDSPAFYKGPNGENWLIATGKESHDLAVYDAATGKTIKRLASPGSKKNQLQRPNGIWIIDNLLFVVERDNKRVQAFLMPEFKHLGYIGADDLIKPYGLSVHKDGENYIMYVTDNYETADEQIPPTNELDKRVKMYEISIDGENLNSKLIKAFGETEGDGILQVVESIYADPENGNLFISEENEENTYILIYSLDGKYKNKIIGKDLFKYQCEGIAIYDCGNGEGFIFITDQHEGDNTFHLFDRKTFEHIGYFKPKTTQNTDGIWLTQEKIGDYDKGLFFAVNNDGGVGAFDLNDIFNKLNINCN